MVGAPARSDTPVAAVKRSTAALQARRCLVGVDMFAPALAIDAPGRRREGGEPGEADVGTAVVALSVAVVADPLQRGVDLAQSGAVPAGNLVVEVGGGRRGRTIAFVRDLFEDRRVRRLLSIGELGMHRLLQRRPRALECQPELLDLPCVELGHPVPLLSCHPLRATRPSGSSLAYCAARVGN